MKRLHQVHAKQLGERAQWRRSVFMEQQLEELDRTVGRFEEVVREL